MRRAALALDVDEISVLRQQVATQAAALAAIGERLARLEAAPRRSGAGADRRLRKQLADSTEGLAFKVSDLSDRLSLDPALTRALDAAMIDVRQLGHWLRDHAGLSDGISVRRGSGRRWVVEQIDTSDT